MTAPQTGGPTADQAGIPEAALPPQPPLRDGVDRRFATTRAVVALMLREMATRYGRSPGGYLWALLEPVGAILVFALAFSLILRSPPLGNSFILFFATGFLPFQVYNTVSNNVGRSINFSRALLHYPAVTWVDALLARFTLNALTEIFVMVLLLSAILVATDTRSQLEPIPILQAVGLTALLGLSVGVINCALFGLFPIWMQLWSIATRPLFLASGIFFLYGDMPQTAQAVLWYNPLIHIIGLARIGFYPTYVGNYISIPFVVIVCLVLLFLGVILLGRYHRDILHNG